MVQLDHTHFASPLQAQVLAAAEALVDQLVRHLQAAVGLGHDEADRTTQISDGGSAFRKPQRCAREAIGE